MKKSFLILFFLCCLASISYSQIDATENQPAIGIGVTSGSPNYIFSYDGSNDVGHYAIGWYHDSWYTGGATGYLSGYGGIKLFTSGLPRVAITHEGYVGIGTMSPTRSLEIDVNSSSEGLKILNTGTVDGRATISYSSNKFGTPYNWEVGLGPGGGNNFWGIRNISYAGSPVVFGIDPNNKMFLGNNLYRSPGAKLYVKSDGNTSSTQSLRIDNSSGSNIMVLNDDGSATIAGSVGIGTSVQSAYKLAVNGDAIFNKVKVQQYPWADFVFEKNYHLMPLADLENYIDSAQHLPEIPTEKEIEKQGLDMGDIVKKQMQKIEELTLYVIDQNKKIQQLEQRVSELENKETELKNK